ncbi:MULTISPECIES: DNA-binding transcriptional regulator [Bradyrhizobium]|uniref:DNA-binding transcriptional regulator n=1 Tax=Bradyrhizobium TaxID=374 RepID=UPI000231CDA8|nr:DNA-binding transcriptional regulator [Bradyrhizobium japonicum]AJA62676.1 transcriptional regulator [Bradyrhizobium japonicum]KMJ98476.1 transcriptional regulator [Bradyrhizobium japonicum]MBR0758755.1 DNA-binding transcriptional regulator [Bradyrhizobium japonicum]MCS3540813.1 IclR family mhp operon transcriptional activator [Bradyrhizobium japonicum]MCS3992004.1 IclR family mhp operon transcriptional activator [Bradyrhizobium japonicum]
MSKERTRKGQPRQSEGVRAFKRGLDVLQEVNRSGGIRAGDVARALDLPRPTVYRLLETLEELGYVARSASDDRFRVTRRALSLGDGYDPGVVICQAAAPFLAELSKTLVWPVDLSTYENAAMVVQETTHSRSPLSIDRGMIGKRLPMLRTSAGRAYLAACPARERDLIVNHLRRIDEADDRPFLDQARLDQMIAETAARGYAIRSEGEYNPKTASIAVPIKRNGAVFGCISIIWIRSALGIEEAVAQFAAQLQETASAIPVEV